MDNRGAGGVVHKPSRDVKRSVFNFRKFGTQACQCPAGRGLSSATMAYY